MGKSCGKKWVRRYFHTNGQCKPFLYRGCRGNTNNFENKSDCKAYCLTKVTRNQFRTTAAPSTGNSGKQFLYFRIVIYGFY